jgi:hypothetical protein
MKKLKESALRVGDIILTTSPEKVSKAIRTGTKSDISHAMIYVQAHSVIDATGNGVHARNTQRLHYDDDLAIHVFRMGRGLGDEEALRIISYARAVVGSEYSIGEALQSVRKKRMAPTRKQFCSRLAARAYAEAGIALVKDPNYCTPEELKNSPLLIEVFDVTETITQAQIDAIIAVPDAPQRGQNATNALLKAARERNPDIQDLNDIDKHLMAHPEDDTHMSCALHESGYLVLWEEELARHPERYDLLS